MQTAQLAGGSSDGKSDAYGPVSTAALTVLHYDAEITGQPVQGEDGLRRSARWPLANGKGPHAQD